MKINIFHRIFQDLGWEMQLGDQTQEHKMSHGYSKSCVKRGKRVIDRQTEVDRLQTQTGQTSEHQDSVMKYE